MDQITHEVRLARWKEAIKQCQSRPEGQSMDPVGFDLFGDRSGIFTEVTGISSKYRPCSRDSSI